MVEVFGLAGQTDLLIRVVAVDTDDLYRIAGLILDVPGVERTDMDIAMRELIAYRMKPSVSEIAERRRSPPCTADVSTPIADLTTEGGDDWIAAFLLVVS